MDRNILPPAQPVDPARSLFPTIDPIISELDAALTTRIDSATTPAEILAAWHRKVAFKNYQELFRDGALAAVARSQLAVLEAGANVL